MNVVVPSDGRGLSLLASVRLVQPLRAEGEELPAGATGTIVEVLDPGRAYIVEFFEPSHAVVTVHDGDLVPTER